MSFRHAASAFLALALGCTQAGAADVSGRYSSEGTNVDGTMINGTVIITLTPSATCEISWQVGDVLTEGICLEVDDTLAASYLADGKPGLVVYTIREDGVLVGVRTAAGMETTGIELLFREQ